VPKRELTADQKRWRAALERVGPEIIRLKLDPQNTGVGSGAEVRGVVNQGVHPPRGFVEDWLAEKAKATDRRETLRFWAIMFASVIAALAGVAALFR